MVLSVTDSRVSGAMGIKIEACAGHHFRGKADLQCAFHCTDGKRKGYFHKRKRLRDRKAFDYDPRLGWETDCWFEWFDSEPLDTSS